MFAAVPVVVGAADVVVEVAPPGSSRGGFDARRCRVSLRRAPGRPLPTLAPAARGRSLAKRGAVVTRPVFREDEPADEAVTEAVGRASEALEYVERARGHLYSLHQLIGRADFLFEEAADLFREAGQADVADALERDIVGRNVLDGRWTFQIVDEFDDLYHDVVSETVRSLERRFHDGERHVYEARMKERRRTQGRPGHEHRPAAAFDPGVEVDPDTRTR